MELFSLNVVKTSQEERIIKGHNGSLIQSIM